MNNKHQGGFTLVEMMIALLLSGMVMSAIYAAFQSQQRSYSAQDQVAEMQQNIRAGLNIMLHEIRMAGYDPTGNNGVGFISATSTSINFTHVADFDGVDNDNADGDNNSSTGADEPGEIKNLTYDLYDAYTDGDTDLGRVVGALRRAVAENIEAIEFQYTLNDGTTTLTPATLANIRGVRVSILARAGTEDYNFFNTDTYTTASGATWGPYNDNYRRRLLIKNVRCRNMGL